MLEDPATQKNFHASRSMPPHNPRYGNHANKIRCAMMATANLGIALYARAVMLLPNVRDHRWLPVARFLLRSEATRRKRDAGSHSVDRIVRLFYGIDDLSWKCFKRCDALSENDLLCETSIALKYSHTFSFMPSSNVR
jgi:hypothetical protein